MESGTRKRSKGNDDSNKREPEHYAWSIYSNPVFYGTKSSCNKQELGKQEYKLSEKHGPIIIGNGVKIQEFFDPDLDLMSQNTIWSKSLSLSSMNKTSIQTCSNIFHQGHVKTAEALFTAPFAGKVIFRENELLQTMIYTNLFATSSEYKQASKHDWRILVTDVLDTTSRSDKCNYLSQVFDPNNLSEDNCNTKNHAQCKMGELSKKHGPVTIGSANNRYSKFMFMDTNLPLSSFVSSSLSSRQLFLVIYEKNRILGCAQIREIKERQVKADFDMDGVRGFIRFSQRYLLDPTVVTVSLKNLMGRGKHFHIHEFPVPPKSTINPNTKDLTTSNSKSGICSELNVGNHFNPFQINQLSSSYPSPGDGTNDEYMVGDLSGKFGLLSEVSYFEHQLNVFVDLNLPLFGSNSIIGRSVLINNAMNDWTICATINYPDEVITAEATFYYPIYGKAIFKQIESDSLSETSVFVDLSYSDITVNETDGHGWNIHGGVAGADFYNWTKRCASAGEQFNPFEVGDEMGKTAKCSIDNPLRCPIGDLTSKSGKMLSISSYRGSRNVKLFYTDTILPLSGPASIIGRSLVIHDDNAPMIRGRRMACTVIKMKHSLSASVRKWRVEQGTASNVSGFITFHQDNVYDKTIGKLTLHGLNNLAGGYHVHEVSVPADREFPCSSDSVYGHYNPLRIDVSVGPLPGASTTDQYELGDISGKFGLLTHMPMAKLEFVDHNLPLFGTNSIIGRSIVIHKKEKSSRWVCGTIQVDVDKQKAREVVAIASFDDPRHAVSGYVRFKQIEYKDGSLSPTWMEVSLRHGGSGQGAGQHNRNVTEGHSWSIFVNQVGADAFNDVPTVKCLAAGFKWNPYLSASDNKYYKTDCNPHNILRCEMGDLTGKHGPLVIGGKRIQISDENLPLVGNFSIINRSLVIFTEKRNNLKMACANIKPDVHLVSSIAVRRHPTFTVARFMDHVRDSLESAPWLISPDLDQTKLIINGECIQISIHFYGKSPSNDF